MKKCYDYGKEKTTYPYFEIHRPLEECPHCKRPGMLETWTNWNDDDTAFEFIVQVKHIPVDKSGELSNVHEVCELLTLPVPVGARKGW